jgi:glycosyltransferase involved in cell wall biosynthesis
VHDWVVLKSARTRGSDSTAHIHFQGFRRVTTSGALALVAPDAADEAGETSARVTVLHMTEALGGGVTTALLEYVRSTPQCTHWLAYAERGEHDIGDDLSQHFDRLWRTAPGALGFARGMPRRAAREADIIHYHSSWAGLIGRLTLWTHRAKTVYSPHCYFFERTDVSRASQVCSRLLEFVLARLSRATVCVSPHEALLAAALHGKPHYVPNEVSLARVIRAPRPRVQRRPRVIGIGRLTAQKDPLWFAEVVEAAAAEGLDADWTWVGEGSPRHREPLENLGVCITGWLPRREVLELLSHSDVYLHTAAWEGSPMTIHEADALGIPIVARSIPALCSLGYPAGIQRPADAVEALRRAFLPGPADAHPTTSHARTVVTAVSLATVYGSLLPAARPLVITLPADSREHPPLRAPLLAATSRSAAPEPTTILGPDYA